MEGELVKSSTKFEKRWALVMCTNTVRLGERHQVGV